MITILRDAGLSRLIESESLERLAEGFQFTEGPLWCSDGLLLFQDIKAERTYRLGTSGALEVLREQTGAANGQTFARDGRIVFCEQNGRRVSRMNRDGSRVETVAETWSGQRLNSPNDIVARSDGLLFFTDPPYGVEPAQRCFISRDSMRSTSPARAPPQFACSPTTSRSPTVWRSHPTSGFSTSATRRDTMFGLSKWSPLEASEWARAESSRGLTLVNPAGRTG